MEVLGGGTALTRTAGPTGDWHLLMFLTSSHVPDIFPSSSHVPDIFPSSSHVPDIFPSSSYVRDIFSCS